MIDYELLKQDLVDTIVLNDVHKELGESASTIAERILYRLRLEIDFKKTNQILNENGINQVYTDLELTHRKFK